MYNYIILRAFSVQESQTLPVTSDVLHTSKAGRRGRSRGRRLHVMFELNVLIPIKKIIMI